jgi:hypothetical protein
MSSMTMSGQLPDPSLRKVYRLEAILGAPLDLGEVAQRHRRSVRGVRHGSAEDLARLGRGEDVDAGEYTFRTSTQIETAAPGLDWLNKGVFISVGARQSPGVIYETYLVE